MFGFYSPLSSENIKKWEEASKTVYKINEIYEPFSRKLDFQKPEQSLEDLKIVEIKIKDLKNDDKDYDIDKIHEALKSIGSLKDSLEKLSEQNKILTNLKLIPYVAFILFSLFLFISLI